MSTSGLTNQYIPPTLDGLTVIDADQIYIDGQLVDLATLVPYTGADKPVDVGAQPIRTTYAPVGTNDVVNLQALTDAITYVDNSVALTYLSKISTVTQSVAGPVSFTNGVQTSTNKDVSLASTVIITPNYPNATVYDGGVTAGSRFGTITNSGGVYQSTSSGDGGVLVLGSGLSSGRVRLMINLLVNDTNGVAVSLFGSSDGVNPYQSIASHTFPPNTTTFWVSDTTFTLSYPYIILICNTASPGLGATVKWYGLTLYQMGVALNNITLPAQTGDRVVVLDANKRLVASGINTTKLGYLDNVSSDIQTQINSKASITYVDSGLAGKLNLSGSNANQNINLGSFKVQSNATPTASTDYITKAYGDSTYALTSALSGYVPYTGATADLNMGSRFVLCNSDPSSNNQLTRKSYVDTLIAERVPRTGDTGLVGDYQTSGRFTGSSLSSTGGISGSFYTTASAGIPYSNTSDKGKWFKIINVGTVDMKFYLEGHITYSVGGYHSHIHFIASVTYNSRPCIRIVHSSFYGSAIVERLRLSTDNASIYNQGFIEMYLGNNTWNDTTIYVYGVNSSPINTSYSLVSTKTAGTSTGFTYQTVYTEVMTDIHMSGTRFYIDAGSNMGNSGEIRPGTSVVWGNMGDCRIYNGTADAYNPTSTANNLIIKSWWGIGYESYDGGVRIAMDTRTGSAYFGGNIGIGVTDPNAKLHVSNGDNSKAYFGPNSSWGAYLFVGSGTSNINATTAQCLSTNGNLHLDGGYGKDIYIGYYPNNAGQPNNIYSYAGSTWTHNGNMTINGQLTTNSTIKRGIFPATTQTAFNNTFYPLMMCETDGVIRHGSCSMWRYANNSIAWTPGTSITYLYYKASTYSSVMLNINASWYSAGVGFRYMYVVVYQEGNPTYQITKTLTKYVNTTYSHETLSFHTVIPASELSNVGWYGLYVYQIGGATSDTADVFHVNCLVIG